MEFQTPSYTIDQIVKWIDTGRLALPEFQRDFVWPPGKVADLLDSVSRGWPVGSVLILEGPQPFEPKPIDKGPPLAGDVRFFVLDGQQRLTALYHAVSDASDVVYLVDFAVLAAGTGDEYVYWMKRRQAKRELGNPERRAARYVALASEVFDAQRFHIWQSFLSPERATEATGLRERYLSGLKSQVYKLPAIQLDQEIKLEALARIFESVNRSGVRLNAFDLMVAVLYPHQFKLRDKWETAQSEHPTLTVFDVDGLELLKLVALRERSEQLRRKQKVTVAGVRQGDVLMIPPARVRADWDRCVEAYVGALKFVRKHFGVVAAGLVPAESMLLTLAFALDQGVDVSSIGQWYWSAVIEQSYAQGANTRVTKDADLLLEDAADSVASVSADRIQETLLEPIKRNQTLLRGVAGLLVSRGVDDPVTGGALGAENPPEFASIDSLAAGEHKLDLTRPLADVVLLSPLGRKRAIAAVRSGKPLHAVLKPESLVLQGFGLDSLWSSERTELRAQNLSRFFLEAMETA